MFSPCMLRFLPPLKHVRFVHIAVPLPDNFIVHMDRLKSLASNVFFLIFCVICVLHLPKFFES